jgi:hypothetical protein
MAVIRFPSKTLKGLSFSVAELTLIKAWSAANTLTMVVRLDHGSEVEEYEEVLAFHLGKSPLCRWIMWRNATTVFIQPLIGRTQTYGSVAEAFEAIAAKCPVVLTDIEPDGWPA